MQLIPARCSPSLGASAHAFLLLPYLLFFLSSTTATSLTLTQTASHHTTLPSP